MNFLVRMLLFISVFTILSMYILYKIYESSNVFYIVPAIIILPFAVLIFFRTLGRYAIVERALGQYLFYFNYLITGIMIIFILFLLLKLFSIDFLKTLSYKRKIFEYVSMSLLIILGIIGNSNFKNISIYRNEIFIDKKANLEKIKIGFISDVHLNQVFDGEKLRYALDKFQENNVDIIFIGGDLLDNKHSNIKDDIKKILEKYTKEKFSFKYGIYTILGNHEYYGGIEENIAYIKDLGIKILRDDILKIEGIYFIGRDDNHNKYRKNIDTLIENLPKESPVIVLDHNPKSLQESIDKKIDFQLSGHTHNGQIFPINLITKYMYLNSLGYKKIENTNTYVSSGLGTWMIPYRIGSKSELAIIDLKFK